MARMDVDLSEGEAVLISPGGQARVELIHKSGRRVRLRISADREVAIQRDNSSKAVAPRAENGSGFVPRLAD